MEDGIKMPELNFGAGTQGRRTPEGHRLEVALRQISETGLYVDKMGQVHEQHVPPPYNGRPVEQGHTPLIWANGQLVVAKKFADEGITLYREWCDEEPERFKLYRDMMRARVMADHGKGPPVRVPDPSKLYPKKLMEHRKRAADGNVTGKAWVPGEGEVPADKADQIAEAVKSLGLTPPKKRARA